MFAWQVDDHGHYREKLRWRECDRPTAPQDGVLLRVAAAGVNFPDILAIAGKYQVKAPTPFSPGLEAVGTVCAAGPASRFQVGERVVATASFGAHAEYMAASDRGVFRVPASMSDADAAGLVVCYQTAHVALHHRARLAPGQVLLVHGGAGGVGTAAIQLARACGATIIATAGSDAKLEICRDCGADHVINYRSDDFVERVLELTQGRGADVIYDPIGGKVFEQSLKCIAFAGKLLIIGFASGRIPEIAANRILLRNIDLIGLYWGNYLDRDPALVQSTHEALCRLYQERAIKPVIYREFTMPQLPEALACVESRQSYGKVVLRL
jgi:NADPH2:quinone reductase